MLSFKFIFHNIIARRLPQILGILIILGTLTQPAHAAPPVTMTVNTTADTVDVTPGNGVCNDSSGNCSLRAAIMEANADPGSTIRFDASLNTTPIVLTRTGNDYTANAGDLDINASTNIVGNGASNTIIQAATNASYAGSIQDKVLGINQSGLYPNLTVSFSGLTIRYGDNNIPTSDPDFAYTGGGVDVYFTGSGNSTSFTDCVISDNRSRTSYGGGLNVDSSATGTNTLTLTNVTFSNNSTLSTTSTSNGGALNVFGNNVTINIQNSTFANNTVPTGSRYGGAINFDPNSGSLTIDGTIFSGNSAQSGGAVHINDNTATIRHSQFTGNTATDTGGAVAISSGTATIQYNRIVGNSATTTPTSDGIAVYGGTVNATENWWGCSTGPSGAPCDTAADISGSGGVALDYNPWFRDQLTTTPSPLVVNQSTALTASFLTNSAGAAVPVANLTQIIGRGVTWGATLGTLSGTQATVQATGTATGTFQASGIGTAVIYAQVDNDNTSGASSNVLSLTINKADTTTAITDDAPDPSVVGQSVTVSYTVTGAFGNTPTAPTGSVTISDGTDTCTGTLAAGAGSCAITLSTAGVRTLTATYAGDTNFNLSPASAGVSHTVNQAPAITSVNSATFTVGSAGTFTVTTTGFPTGASMIISETGALPSGISFTDNGNGTATLAGTPAAGTGGVYPITITANNGVLPNGTQVFTLTVNSPPVITSANSTTFEVNVAGSFTVTTTPGYPIATTITATGALPSGIGFSDNGDGTAILTGTPNAGTSGTYPLILTASNGILPNATQPFTLTVQDAPSTLSFVRQTPATTPTNADTLIFRATFSEAVTGVDTADFAVDGTTTANIPNVSSVSTSVYDVTVSGGDLASFNGTVGLNLSAGQNITDLASNALPNTEPPIDEIYTLDNTLPTITNVSSPHANGAFATGEVIPITITFSEPVNVTGTPQLTLETGATDEVVNYTSGSGTNTLTFTYTVQAGDISLDLDYLATNSLALNSGTIQDAASNNATLTLAAPGAAGSLGANKAIVLFTPLAITSANNVTFTVGTAGSFTVTTTGFPIPAITRTGALPTGVSFTDNGDGTATLSGTPAAGSGGTYNLTFTASNGASPDATQNFTLTINQAPAITSANNTGFTVGVASSFTVTTTGFPTSAIARAGILPTGVTFVDNGNGTGTLSGTPAAGTSGVYVLTFTANNGATPNATQNFTLIIGQAPAITSANNVTFTVGTASSFTVTATGYPIPAITRGGAALPGGVNFVDNGNGTATLSGTPAAGTGGTYNLTFTASNGVPPNDAQNFTLTINQAPAITSANNAAFAVGAAGSFTVTTTGFPIPAIVEAGALPAGVTFVDNGNGTATLSGTPNAGTGGTYNLTITANNTVLPNATQNFTLTVGEAPAITSANNVTFVAGNPSSFTITTTGSPAPAITRSGTLPSGMNFTDNGNGTATLAGTPALGSVGTYNLILTAQNGVAPNATQNFTLSVNGPPGVTLINSSANTGDGQVLENEHTSVAITQLLVVFNKDMNADTPLDLNDALNPANYSLVQGVSTAIPIALVTYDAGTHTVTLGIAALPDGAYALTVLGRLEDTLGAPIGTDFVRHFSVDNGHPHHTSIVTVQDNITIVSGTTVNAHFSSIDISFDEDLYDPAGDIDPDDVTNAENYLLVTPGPDGIFQTISCAVGIAGDDVALPVGPITYTNHGGSGPFVATAQLNGGTALPNGLYRLLICGTTSLVDLAFNPLNGDAGPDSQVDFTVLLLSGARNPKTGFAPGVVTVLPEQPADKAYASLGNLWIEIPKLNLKTSITGVPLTTDGWDLTWLNRQVGWLAGTAYPTWEGNSVLTAHGYTADGEAGPFALLKNLSYGETIVIHLGGMKYTYAVRMNTLTDPNNTYWLTKHEKQDWITLITCQQYDENTQSYRYRRVVRAVLVKVEEE